MLKPHSNNRNTFLIFAWALYDLANQFFALNIVSLYFVRWLTLEKQVPEILYSLTFGFSTFIVAVLAPVLGAMADAQHRYKPPLIQFTLLAIIFTIFLGFTEHIVWALLFFAVANIGCQGAIIFYNALMLDISPKNKIGLVSGIGKMCGYVGAIVALLLTKPIVVEKGYRAVFLLSGVLFLIFSLPCLIFLKDRSYGQKVTSQNYLRKEIIISIYKNFKATIFNMHQFRGFKEFLKAAFFGLCVVNVIMLFMSVYATKVFRLTAVQIIDFIAFSTFFAIFGSIISGAVSDKIGYRSSMIGVFFFWCVCLACGAFLNPPFHWLVGALGGFSLGATWVVSRALVIKIVPAKNIGEVFGLFNLIGYISGISGPIFWGIILLLLKPLGEWGYRLALFSLIPFMLAGIFFLYRIPQPVIGQQPKPE